MRQLNEHQVDGENPLTIQVTDAIDRDGINHRYELSGFSAEDNNSAPEGWTGRLNKTVLLFQDGEVGVAGVNGLTQEALLVVVLDRLRQLVKGPYPETNRLAAIGLIESALIMLHGHVALR